MRYDAVLLDDLGVLSATADGSLLPYVLELRARRLGVEPARCIVVDDLAANVRGAVAAGMTGVHHVALERTMQELAALLV